MFQRDHRERYAKGANKRQQERPNAFSEETKRPLERPKGERNKSKDKEVLGSREKPRRATETTRDKRRNQRKLQRPED